MIPKVIHYCWFGGNPLPELAQKCIKSWKIYCPDYEIKEWNEKNFDINACEYTKEAAEAGKWAFVSDYARFWILYNYGGLYFDTDVELINSIDDLVENGPFLGCEQDKDGLGNFVAPGLGMAAEREMAFYKDMIDFYNCQEFYKEDGAINDVTIVAYTTEKLHESGYIYNEGVVKQVCGITIYPQDYFCPMNYYTGKIALTANTRSIHHYSMSWKSDKQKKLKKIERTLRNKLGNKIGWFIYRCIYAFAGKNR